MTDSLRRISRLLREDEQWGRPVRDEWHGSVKPRIHCQVGGRSNPYQCVRGATWLVGRKKLCEQHAKKALNG